MNAEMSKKQPVTPEVHCFSSKMELSEYIPPQSREKIGEIYRLSSENLLFSCSHCDDEFSVLEQFVEHIQTHLHEIFTVFIGPDGMTTGHDDDVNMKASCPDIKCEPFTFADDIVAYGEDHNLTVEKFENNANNETMPTTHVLVEDSRQRRSKTCWQCPHCDYKCATNAMLENHSILHSNQRDLKCAECPMTFISNKHLTAHKRIHYSPAVERASDRAQIHGISKIQIGKIDLRCLHCDFVTKRACALASHMKKHADERNYACKICPETFKTNALLFQHKRRYHYLEEEDGNTQTEKAEPSTIDKNLTDKRIHSGSNSNCRIKFECYLCGLACDSRSTCIRHIRKAHSINTVYNCICCDYKCNYKTDLFKHATECCYESRVCRRCGLMFANQKAKRQHLATHEKCDKCSKTFKNGITLCTHECVHVRRVWKCKICDQDYKSNSGLVLHMISVHEEQNDKTIAAKTCPICAKTVATSSYLKQHMKRHTGAKLLLCEICGYGVPTPSELLHHMTKHTEQRDFKCDVCSKTFKSDKHMKTHKLLTHGPKRSCNICKKSVAVRFYSTHMRGHNMAFECLQCDKRFANKGVLKIHMTLHSEQRDFECDLCPKMFKAKRNLVAHRRIHLSDFLCTCQWCGKGFHENRNYKKHTLAAHGRKWTEVPLTNGQQDTS